jgi:hypothetical protein
MIDSAYTDTNGNGDGAIQPSESGYLDIRVKNNTNTNQYSISATLTSTNDYVTINQGTVTMEGDLSVGYYKTLTHGQDRLASYAYLLSDFLYKAFKFTINSTCPMGTNIDFTVTFTDSWGTTWTEDTLTVPVVATGASIAINTPVTDNYRIREAANGNGDGNANPHETHYLDIRIKNGGTSKALGLQAELSTTSDYVTIDQKTATIGDLSAGYYKTLTYGASLSALGTSLLDSLKAFKFTISDTCPVETGIPFTVTFTDSWGTTWEDSLTIPVIRPSLGILTPVTDNYQISEAANGNGDGKANPQETHYLDIRIKNGESSKVLGLQAKLSTASDYVTIDRETMVIGDLSAGSSTNYLSDSAKSTQAFKFTISDTCPVGTPLPFTVTFTGGFWGYTWVDTLTIPVE